MNEENQKAVTKLALKSGEIMLKSGAEIYRVEDTVTRICKSYDAPYAECFATTTGVFVSMDHEKEDSDLYTLIKRIPIVTIDLAKISEVNDFSREKHDEDPKICQAYVEKIDEKKPYPTLVNMLGAALIATPMCYLLGGNILDSVVGGLIAAVTLFFSSLIDRLFINAFIKIFLGCALCGALTLVYAHFISTTAFGWIIIAAITMFLPGVAITNAARDYLTGDMVGGTARAVEALLTAVTMGAGVGFVLKLWQFAGGIIPVDSASEVSVYIVFFLAFFTAVGFSIIFHVPARHIAVASLIGGCGYLLYFLVLTETGSVLIGCFFGAGLVSLLSEVASRVFKDITTIFIIPGIIPIVPGTGMYLTMFYAVDGQLEEAINTGVQTLIAAVTIALALAFVASIVKILISLIDKLRK